MILIEHYVGSIGSGKSYHALEDAIDYLRKGKYVIANFPLKFSESMKKRGYEDRFMYVADEYLYGVNGVKLLFQVSREIMEDGTYRFFGKESSCLVIIDEAGNHFDPLDSSKPEQRLWSKFFTMSRKLGYDFILISQIEKQINRIIRGCVEYTVDHRLANRVFPIKYLPWKIFAHVIFWKRQRIGSGSTILVKKFADLYDTEMLFGNIVDDMSDFEFDNAVENSLFFGNCAMLGVPAGVAPLAEGEPAGVPSLSENAKGVDENESG